MEIATDRAVSRNGLARTSPLREEILSRGQIICGHHEPTFRVPNDQGTLLTADGFIAERSATRKVGSFSPRTKRESAETTTQSYAKTSRRSRAAKSWSIE